MAEVVKIGAFFDGTGGNKDNDKKIQDGALTNVSKLYEVYKESGHIPLYEEGVGTRKYMDGKTLTEEQAQAIRDGKATRLDYYGKFDMAFGLEAKDVSNSMMKQLGEQIKNIRKDNPDAQIAIDVVGFSRGAAISRDFVNSVNEKYKDDKNVGVDLVVLYDTVASVGTKDDLYNGGLNLNLNEHSANQIYQFVAKDEYRVHFPLHSGKDKDGNLPKNMEEIVLYGAHADIGGGYPDHYQDSIIKEQGSITYLDGYDKRKKIEDLCKSGEEKGYERYIDESVNNGKEFLGTLHYQCVQKEDKTNELARVALHVTHQIITKHGTKLNDLDSFGKDYMLPEQLKDYAQAIMNNEDISKYQDTVKPYISESGRSIIPKVGEVREPNIFISTVNMKRDVREVFNNKPENAVTRDDDKTVVKDNDRSVGDTEKTGSGARKNSTSRPLEELVKEFQEFKNSQQEMKRGHNQGIDRHIDRTDH